MPLELCIIFNYIADIEDFILDGQSGGVDIKRKKMYCDRICGWFGTGGKNKEEIRSMLENIRRYVKKKKLILNVKK